MWVEKRGSWLATVALSGFALPHIWTRTLAVTALSVLVTILYERVPALHHSLTVAPFTLVGLPLGIFLGFRNNTAYDRYWEGRKLWGALVNTSRSLTRQLLTLLEPQPEAAAADRAELRQFEVGFVHLVIGYAHALRHHLRETDPFPELIQNAPQLVEALHGDDNVPLALLQGMGDRLVEARRRHWIHAYHVPVLEQSLGALTDIQGACERIKSTPIPYSYTVLMHRLVAVYCCLLPLGLMDTVQWGTPFVVLAISYAFFGLDAIGDEVEQPFGTDTNDLPLEAISRTIERNLRRRLGEEMPPELVPRRGLLR